MAPYSHREIILSMEATTFKITTSLQYLEGEILKKTGMLKTAFHKHAIQDFLAGDQKIEERLKIRRFSDPRYVKKDALEQIYLDSFYKEKLKEVAEREGCGITVVLFQALLDYCVKCSFVLEVETVDQFLFRMK